MDIENALPALLKSEGFRAYLEASLKETTASGRECEFHVSFNPSENRLTFPEEITIGNEFSVSKDSQLIQYLKEQGITELANLSPDELFRHRINYESSRARMVVPDSPLIHKEIGGSDTYRKVFHFHTHPHQTHGEQVPFFSDMDLEHYVRVGFPFGGVMSTSGRPGEFLRGFVVGINSNGQNQDYAKTFEQLALYEFDVRRSNYDGDVRRTLQPTLTTQVGIFAPIFFKQGKLEFDNDAMNDVGNFVLGKNSGLLRPFRRG